MNQNEKKPYAVFYEITDGPCKLRYEIKAKETRIGRYSQNDIIIDDERVSRWHGRIIAKEGMYYFEDYSKNGVKINGQHINFDEACLGQEAVILLGDGTFHFMISERGIEELDDEAHPENHANIQEYKITIKTQTGKIESHIIKKAVVTIGRSTENDIILDPEDTHISRNHARILLNDKGSILEDYSLNGTLINSEYLHNTQRELNDGDIIRIGNTRALFEICKPETK